MFTSAELFGPLIFISAVGAHAGQGLVAPLAGFLLADVDRLQALRRAVKRGDHRIGQHSELAFVDRGHGVHDGEQGEQQRHEVAVRNGPGLRIHMLFVLLLAGHALEVLCAAARRAAQW